MKGKDLFSQQKDGGELERIMVDVRICLIVTDISIRTDDQERYTETISQTVDDGRDHMVIQTSIVIPCQYDDAIRPGRAIHDSIDGVDCPVFHQTSACGRMFAIREWRSQPAKGG